MSELSTYSAAADGFYGVSADTIRVLLVDDHEIVREGLKGLLRCETGIAVVGECGDGAAPLAAAKELAPDIIVMDVGVRELAAFEATRRFLAEIPESRVIAIAMHAERHSVSQMLSAGAWGYLVKDDASVGLAAGIRAVASGNRYLSLSVTSVVVEEYVRCVTPFSLRSEVTAHGHLSRREVEVLQLIGRGLWTKEIASRLNLSAKTIETHRRQIMKKLGIFTVAGLVKYALRAGLASLDE